MADKTMAYDHPHYIVHQHKAVQCGAVAASTLAQVVPFPHGGIVKEVTAAVNIAGTNASAGYDIYNGTTSVGALTLGTNAALSIVSATLGDVTVADNSYLEFRTKANSATMAAGIDIEWRPTPGANVTA